MGAAIISGEGFVFGDTGVFGTQALALQVAVPEPGTAMLLLFGLVSIAAAQVRLRRRLTEQS